MRSHRRRTLAAIVAVGTLVAAALVVLPARATPSSDVTTTILAKSLFDDIHVNARAHTPDHWKAKLKTHGQSDVYVVDNRFAPGGTTGRNETGAVAETIAVQLLPKAAERRIDVPVAPGNCPF